MPNAFRNSGWLSGIILTLFIGILCTYCIYLLVKSEYELCVKNKIPSMTYPVIAQHAFQGGPRCFQKVAKYIPIVINIFILTFQLGVCVVYVMFIGSNIKAVADYYTDVNLDLRLYMLMLLLPIIFINWVRNLKYLAPLSIIANVITLVTFAIICYYLFREPISFDDRTAFGTLEGIPLFFGTVLFALEAIGIMLPLENEMEQPQRFVGRWGVLYVGMTGIVTLYVGMGFFGYIRYGADSEGSITLNLPQDEALAQSVKLLLSFAIYITHALQCYPAILIIWNEYIKDKTRIGRKGTLGEYTVRTSIVLSTFILAIAVPNLALFISLFGALCLSTLGLAFPALIQILIHYKTKTGCAKFWLYSSNIFLIFVGLFGLIIGTAISLKEIILTFS